MKVEESKLLLNDVLQLLQRAKYDATGEDVMRIAAVIQTFHKWATDYVVSQETKVVE